MAQGDARYDRAILGLLVLSCALQTWAILALAWHRDPAGGSDGDVAAGAEDPAGDRGGPARPGDSGTRPGTREPLPEQLMLAILELEESAQPLSPPQAAELAARVREMSVRYDLQQYTAEVLQQTLREDQRAFLSLQYLAAQERGEGQLRGNVTALERAVDTLRTTAGDGLVPLTLPVQAVVRDPPYDLDLLDHLTAQLDALQADAGVRLDAPQAQAIAPPFEQLLATHPLGSDSQRLLAELTDEQRRFVRARPALAEPLRARPTDVHAQVLSRLDRLAAP